MSQPVPATPLFDPRRAEQAMASAGIDVVFATTRTNVGYLTGGYYCHHIARQPFHVGCGFHDISYRGLLLLWQSL